MKILKQSSLLLLMVLALGLSSCADKSKLLVRTWMVDNLKYTREIPAEMQPQIDRVIDGLRQSFRLTYNADGTYVTTNNEEVLKGRWKLNWNGTKITSTSEKGQQQDYQVMELTDAKFTFKAVEGGEEVIFEMIPEKK